MGQTEAVRRDIVRTWDAYREVRIEVGTTIPVDVFSKHSFDVRAPVNSDGGVSSSHGIGCFSRSQHNDLKSHCGSGW